MSILDDVSAQLSNGRVLSWKEVADSPGFKKKTPLEKSEIRDLFYSAVAEKKPEILEYIPKSDFLKEASDYEGRGYFEEAKKTDTPAARWARRLMPAARIAEGSITPILEKVAPGFTKKYRDIADKGGDLIAKGAQAGLEKTADILPISEIKKGYIRGAAEPAGEMVGGISKFAADIPIQLTDPASLATFGAGALLKAAGLDAASSLGKKTIKEGLKDLAAAPREAGERLAETAIRESGLDDMAGAYRSVVGRSPDKPLVEAAGELAHEEAVAAKRAAAKDLALKSAPTPEPWMNTLSEFAEDIKAEELSKAQRALAQAVKTGNKEAQDIISSSIAKLEARPASEFLTPAQRHNRANAISQAVKEGKYVPENILQEFPELAPKKYDIKGKPGTEKNLPAPVRSVLSRLSDAKDPKTGLRQSRDIIRRVEAEEEMARKASGASGSLPPGKTIGMRSQPFLNKLRTRIARDEIGELVGRLYADGATPQQAAQRLGALSDRYAGNAEALKTLEKTISDIGLGHKVDGIGRDGSPYLFDFGAKTRLEAGQVGKASIPPKTGQDRAISQPEAPAGPVKSLTEQATEAKNPIKARIAKDTVDIIEGKGKIPAKNRFSFKNLLTKAGKALFDSNIGIKYKRDFQEIFGHGWHKNTAGQTKTYMMAKGIGDKILNETTYDIRELTGSIANLINSPGERDLFNQIFSLKSMREAAQNNKLYGGITVKDADELLEALKREMIGKGRLAEFDRIDRAVEIFAEKASTISLKDMVESGIITRETAKEWAQKYRYYMKFEKADDVINNSGMIQVGRDEGPVKMSDIYSQYTKTRGGFSELPVMDVLEQTIKFHLKKKAAAHKKMLVDHALAEFSTDIAGEAAGKHIPDLVRDRLSDGREIVVPKEVRDFLMTASKDTQDLFHSLSKNLSFGFRRGVLDLNIKYYRSMVMRDIYETLLRSRGSLTPIGKIADKASQKGIDFISEKFPKVAEKLNLKRLRPEDYDIQIGSVLTPKYWLKAAKEAGHIGTGINTGKIAEYFARKGYTQPHSQRMALDTANLVNSKIAVMPAIGKLIKQPSKRHYQHMAEAISSRWREGWMGLGSLMKSWDDILRHAQIYRNLKPEYRNRLMSLSEISEDMFIRNPEEWRSVVRSTNLDFSQSGEALKTVKTFSPFLNPGMQAMYSSLESFRDMPVTMSVRSAALLSANAASYIKLKNSPAGDNISPFDTQRYGMVDSGFRVKDGAKMRPVIIPVIMIPEILQPLWIPMKAAIDDAYEKNPELRSARRKEMAGNVIADSAGSLVSIGGPMLSVMESLVFNYSLHQKRPIKGDYYKQGTPDYLKASKNTENIYRYMGQRTGMSPDTIKYLAKGIFGVLPDYVAEVDALDKFAGDRVAVMRPTAGRIELPGELKPFEKTGFIRVGKYDQERQDVNKLLEHWQEPESEAGYIVKERFAAAFAPGSTQEDWDYAIEALKEFRNQLPPSIARTLKGIAEKEATPDIGGRDLKSIPKRYRAQLMRAMSERKEKRP